MANDQALLPEQGDPLRPYVALLRAFVEGRLDGDEFEAIYLRLFKGDPTSWPPDIFNILDGLFADCDEYIGWADEDLVARVDGLSELELRDAATAAFEQLPKAGLKRR